jgi:hypothetical protein
VKIKSQRIGATLAIAIFALFTANASEFWVSKDWKHWSKGECENLLTESPWARVWRYRAQPTDPNVPYALLDQLVFSIQLRSALLVREALVRQLQIERKYDKMADPDKLAFDEHAKRMLDGYVGDEILVHVDFSESNGSDLLESSVRGVIAHGNLAASLVTDDGTQISPIRVDMSDKTTHTFDLVFPRTKDGKPIIAAGQKQFSIHFQSPPILYFKGLIISSRRVRVDFDLSKMIANGSVSY